MNVSLRELEDRDLDAIYQQVTDPESIRMAAFTAEDQTDRRAFLDRMSRLRADTSVSHRVIEVDGAVAGTIGSFRIDDQPEVPTGSTARTGGKASRAQHCGFFLPRPPNVHCTPELPRTTSARFEYWRKRGSGASASTAAMHPVAVRRSRRRSCASTEAAAVASGTRVRSRRSRVRRAGAPVLGTSRGRTAARCRGRRRSGCTCRRQLR